MVIVVGLTVAGAAVVLVILFVRLLMLLCVCFITSDGMVAGLTVDVVAGAAVCAALGSTFSRDDCDVLR